MVLVHAGELTDHAGFDFGGVVLTLDQHGHFARRVTGHLGRRIGGRGRVLEAPQVPSAQEINSIVARATDACQAREMEVTLQCFFGLKLVERASEKT